MNLKPKYSNLIIKNIMVYGLFFLIIAFSYKWVFIEETDLLQIIACSLMLILVIFIIYNSRKEIDFFESRNEDIRIRRFPFYMKKKYNLNDVNGYYLSTKFYSIGDDVFDDSDDIKVKCYTIQFKNKTTIQLTELSFKNFEDLKEIFSSSNINYLGKRKNSSLLLEWLRSKI